MKIAITGHKKGIGKAFADQLSARGHEIVGISRSEPCDMVINNAISLYAQTELLFEVWHKWQPSKEIHYIWNISTKLCEQDHDIAINGLTMRESMQYRNQKMALELAHHQLNFQPSNIKMELIRPGDVRTQSFSDPTAITAQEYVKQVLAQQDTV